jgi:hypothetical protein
VSLLDGQPLDAGIVFDAGDGVVAYDGPWGHLSLEMSDAHYFIYQYPPAPKKTKEASAQDGAPTLVRIVALPTPSVTTRIDSWASVVE